MQRARRSTCTRGSRPATAQRSSSPRTRTHVADVRLRVALLAIICVRCNLPLIIYSSQMGQVVAFSSIFISVRRDFRLFVSLIVNPSGYKRLTLLNSEKFNSVLFSFFLQI